MKKASYFLVFIAASLVFPLNACGKEGPRPNILILLADDLGYADLGCYDGIPATPNLDRMASSGIRFTDFYAAAPNCTPSRAGLLTGKSPARLGIYSYRPPNHPMHLRDEEITIAEVLKKQDYQTVHLGKWHLGCLPQDSGFNHPQPCDQGFDYSLGTENNARPSHLNPVNFIRNGKPEPEMEGYSCQIIADEAAAWFENHYDREHPFFMYLAFHEPHVRVAAPPELVENYKGFDQSHAEYLACIENMDLAIGRILDYLGKNGLMENTLILFTSDNGSYRHSSNGRLKAVKSYLYEGGIRVPGIIHYPKLFEKNVVVSEAIGFVDLLPTVCDLLDIAVPEEKELDGTSFLNVLQGENLVREKPLYWYFYRTSPEIAMRIGNQVILGRDDDSIPKTHSLSLPDMTYIKEMDLVTYELYDLEHDIGQNNNLIEAASEASHFIDLLNNQLEVIQEEGYLWKQLPEPRGIGRKKTDWVKY